MKIKKTQRTSQGLTSLGIGAIIGIGDESFINTGVKGGNQREIDFPRLANRLGVYSLKTPKTEVKKTKTGSFNKGNKFSFMRFPGWMVCSSCKKMKRFTRSMADKLNGEVPTCDNPKCRGKKYRLKSIRFVVACELGHLDEFPWWRWAHSQRDIARDGNCQEYDQLFFETRHGVGADWDALLVKCGACGAEQSMRGLEDSSGGLRIIGHKCSGKQPWQGHDGKECGETPVVRQKNASSLYQPIIVSAIDIDSNQATEEDNNPKAEDIKNNVMYDKLLESYQDSVKKDSGINERCRILIEIISEQCECSKDDVLSTLKNDCNSVNHDEPATRKSTNIYELSQSLQEDEWPRFFENVPSGKFINDIETLEVDDEIPAAKVLVDIIEHVSLVKRLREVRVFKGFNRIKFDPGKLIRPSLGRTDTWLPAVEVYGEGIFIAIHRKKLDSWYTRHKSVIDDKMESIEKSYLEKNADDRFGPFSAKFLVLHTLSHLLIRQLSFESGYEAASLRENIYFSDNHMSGILIYTADSDSDGSLGGLVRQGQWRRLLPTILLALEKSTWCSSDPVCRESKGQGEGGLNQGACHTCTLIPETSCNHFNVLLSRTLLIDKEIGFFKDILNFIR